MSWNEHEWIGIQGFPGANHEIAARQLYGDEIDQGTAKIAYLRTFDELFGNLRERNIGRAVVAFSNTSIEEGFIKAPHRELLTRGAKDYWLTDRTEVLVRHQLLGYQGSKLSDIKTVHSMGVALEQCEGTLRKLLPTAQLVHEDDTALSARLVHQWADPTRAAVATRLAGDINELDVVAADIQDDDQNMTSFFGWSLREEGVERMTGNENKTLMLMNVPNMDVAGSLRNALGAFDDQEVSIADIHSISIPGSGTRSKQFLIEADAGFQSDAMQQTLDALHAVKCITDLLGSWREQPEELLAA